MKLEEHFHELEKKKKQFQIDSNDHQNLWRENPHKPLRELQMS